MTLYPTKTRLMLLRDIDEEFILVDTYGQAVYRDNQDAPWGQRVTARWAEAVRAGWVVRPPGDKPKWKPGELTDEGRTVLKPRARPS